LLIPALIEAGIFFERQAPVNDIHLVVTGAGKQQD